MTAPGRLYQNVFSRTPAALRRRILSRISTKHTRPTPTFDGVHLHDDLLEDWAVSAIDAQIRDPGWLRPASGRNRSGAPDRHRTARATGARRRTSARGCSSWNRSGPGSAASQHYADILATSLAGQVLFDYAPLAERARRRALEAPAGAAADAGGARQHQGSARHLREGRAREPARHPAIHQRRSAARVRRPGRPAPAAATSPTRPPRPSTRDRRPTSSISRSDLAPRSRGPFRLGRGAFRAEVPARRGHHARRGSPAGDCDARAAARRRTNSAASPRGVERRRSAGRLGERRKTDHPPAGQLVARRAAAARRARRLHPRGRRIITLPEGAPVSSARRRRASIGWTFGEHVDARVRSRRARCARLLHHRRRSRRGRRSARTSTLRDFNYGALWSISIHEVFPGHFLHYQHLRQVDVEAAQVDPVLVDGVRRRLGALLRADDGRGEGFRQSGHRRPARSARAKHSSACAASSSGSGCTARTCRSSRVCGSSGRRRSSRSRARVAKPSAARSIPSYILYSAGKLMLLKLREDYKAPPSARNTRCEGSMTRCSPTGTVPLVAPSRADARRTQR